MCEKKTYKTGDFIHVADLDEVNAIANEKMDLVNNIVYEAFVKLTKLVKSDVNDDDIWRLVMNSIVCDEMLYDLSGYDINVPYPWINKVYDKQARVIGGIYHEFITDDDGDDMDDEIIIRDPNRDSVNYLEVDDLLEEVSFIETVTLTMLQTNALDVSSTDVPDKVWKWIQDDDSDIAVRVRTVHTETSFTDIFSNVINVVMAKWKDKH